MRIDAKEHVDKSLEADSSTLCLFRLKYNAHILSVLSSPVNPDQEAIAHSKVTGGTAIQEEAEKKKDNGWLRLFSGFPHIDSVRLMKEKRRKKRIAMWRKDATKE
jgi:hypothetical protein